MLDLSALRPRLRAALHAHIDAWFPRTVDREQWGFHQAWDRTWQAKPDRDRFVVFQARMTWFAAQVALRFPERREAMLPVVRHGVDALRTKFLDPVHGGFYWVVDIEGNPAASRPDEKHAYGHAFALYALSAAARATGDPEHLALAIQAFEWMDAHLWDPVHGGTFECTDFAGNRKITPPSPEQLRDLLGTPYGFKAQNSQLHVLEALTELVLAWPDPRAIARLEAMVEVTAVKMRDCAGHLNVVFHDDWRRASTLVSCGHDLEAAFLLVDALRALHRHDPAVIKTARALADFSLDCGWDQANGGLFDSVELGKGPTRHTKVWWVQAETANALLEMHALFRAETDRYGLAAEQAWAFIFEHLVDEVHGGWYTNVSEDGHIVQHADKGHMWKAAYHDGRALMNGLDRLDAMG